MRTAGIFLLAIACDPDGGSTDTGEDSGSPLVDGPFASILFSRVPSDPSSYTVASAMFFSSPGESNAPSEPVVLDACEATPNDTAPATDTPALPEMLSAGDVQLALDGDPVPMAENLGVWSATMADWPGGATVSFSATGGEIPAFDVPDLMRINDEPVDPIAEVLAGGDIALTWGDETVGGHVTLSVAGLDGTVLCLANDDGSFTVPAADAAVAGPDARILVQRLGWASHTAPGIQIYGFSMAAVEVP